IEPNKPKPEEPSTNPELDANSVNKAKEAESEGEPNNLKPGIEPNVAKQMEPNVNPKLTITITTSLNTINKSKFPIMMDM
ncbi:hypothetical protein J1N35_005629, partial [Gossypium stocksii]